MGFKSTLQVSRILGVTVGRLSRAVWDGRISAPTKGPGNAYLWTKIDIERASWALLHKSYKPADSKDNGKAKERKRKMVMNRQETDQTCQLWDAKRKWEGEIEPKPPETLQNILWILKYGRKHWKLVSLMVLGLLILFVVSRLC